MLRVSLWLHVSVCALGFAFGSIECPDGSVCSDLATCCLTEKGYECCPYPKVSRIYSKSFSHDLNFPNWSQLLWFRFPGCVLCRPGALLPSRIHLWPGDAAVQETKPAVDDRAYGEERGSRHPGFLGLPRSGAQKRRSNRFKSSNRPLWLLLCLSWWDHLLQSPKRWLVLLPLLSCE